MKDRHYIGYDEQERGEVFGWDRMHEPTPDETGYSYIDGPYDTELKARLALEENEK